MPPRLPTTTASSHSREHTFRGHRRDSYIPIDRAELVEFRARQRTFNNAYIRTSLANLTSSVVIFRLFDSRFYRSESRDSPPIRTPNGELRSKCFCSWWSIRGNRSYSSCGFLCTNVLLGRGLCGSYSPPKRAFGSGAQRSSSYYGLIPKSFRQAFRDSRLDCGGGDYCCPHP